MPPHSSHILQPLDVGCFGPLKQAYGRQIENLMRANITHITKDDFILAFAAAFQESMTESNIKGGFRGAGLVPLNAEGVLSKLNVQLRTPTPPEGAISIQAPWVSKTPNNPIEASSQSQYIKTRIAYHQNSSPSAIFEAIDHFAKGTGKMMHEVVLLRARVEVLEEANTTISKRRRAKRTRL